MATAVIVVLLVLVAIEAGFGWHQQKVINRMMERVDDLEARLVNSLPGTEPGDA